jgi:HD-like signal output (HDOD) protein
MAIRAENFLLQRYIDKAMVDLPALPAVVMQVVQASQKETVTTAQIEELLRTDAAITTKLLKVVNSAYFGLSRQVSDVGQAIAILGLTQVRNIVLSIGVLNALSSPNPRLAEGQRLFWLESFAAATCAQELARRKGLSPKDQELAFVAGLLHDIGRLFLYILFNQPYNNVLAEAVKRKTTIVATEKRIIGVTHSHLGGVLADKWNFPFDLADLIRNHEIAEGAPFEPLLGAIHAADRIAGKIAQGDGVSDLCPWNPEVRGWTGLDEAGLAELSASVEASLAKAAELVGGL